MTNGLFVFRRDLRIEDNTGLINLCKNYDNVYCVFILDPKQASPKQNEYFSYNAFAFMLETLLELKKQIPLRIIQGDSVTKINQLVKQLSIDAVALNADYTPFSIARDQAIKKSLGVEFIYTHDVCLNDPTKIKPYQVYTPYLNKAKKRSVDKPINMTSSLIKKIKSFTATDINIVQLLSKYKSKITKDIKGGRSEAIKLINNLSNVCKSYSKRDYLTYETSRLGAHLKFGTVSPREIYYACSNGMFRKQLYWRDFYMQISYHFPHVYGNNFRGKIKWSNDKELFKKWCDGETGFDIVDAGMKQLNKTGFMHNRARMVVASFLTKLLHIDWRWGEKYFASKLTDYDPSNNNGGWQWSAGTGVDAQPYFRIFNPYAQAKYDPQGEYVKKWLGNKPRPDPIIDYKKEREYALKLYTK